MSIPVAAAKSEAKHLAKKKLIKDATKNKIKKSVKDNAQKTLKRTGDATKKRIKGSRFNPGSKHWVSPPSYSVRKQHNLLIGMWFASTAVYCFAYYNNGQAIAKHPDKGIQVIDIHTFWKRFIVIQFAFFILSVLVLFETFAKAVGALAVLVFMGILFTNQWAILEGFTTIAKGMQTPKGTPPNAVPQSSGDVTSNTAANNAYTTPPSNNVTSNTAANNSYDPTNSSNGNLIDRAI